MFYITKRFKIRMKVRMLQYLQCGAKTITFLFWASLYVVVLKMTLFKGSANNRVEEWPSVPDNYTKWLLQGPVLGEEDPTPDYSWKEPDNETIADIERRVERVHQVCHNRSMFSQSIHSKEFFVDHEHSIVWCNIFKAASSSWMYNYNILGGYSQSFLARTRIPPIMLARKVFPRPSEEQVRDAVNTPGVVSLLIVREPFVRLLSAYRNKLEGACPRYFRKLAKSMVTKYRHKTIQRFGPIKSNGPSFSEFVAYLIDQYKIDKMQNINEHWAPYYQFCTPCAVNFSVIAKVETLARDSAYVINQLGLAHILNPKVTDRKTRIQTIKNASRDGKKTVALLKYYFSQIDEEMLDELIKIYGMDFELFGYDPKVYYSYVKKNKRLQ